MQDLGSCFAPLQAGKDAEPEVMARARCPQPLRKSLPG